jgi:uncharacterized protein
MTRNTLSGIPESVVAKVDRVREIFVELQRAMIAFSAGVDSTFLLAVAVDTLSAERVLAAMNVSILHPRADVMEARALAGALGVELVEVHGREMEDHRFVANDADRCYFCKLEVFSSLCRLAEIRGLRAVCSGANADDLGDYRPGSRAEEELGVRRPLQEAGLTKREIRDASRAMGLTTADKPSMACLVSRLPYGQPITAERLARVEQAEAVLGDMGFVQHRVRDHDTIARIELEPADLPRALDLREQLVTSLKQLGYRYVTLDLQGFRTGSMNETL